MKKFYITALAFVLSVSVIAQTERSLDEIDQSNSWLKVGALIGAPTGAVSDHT